jgi:hypothetical protein
MPTPHLAASAFLAASTTATTVSITSATTAGNVIIVATSLGLTATVTVTGVTDTKGNSYARATSATATEAWVALNTTALTTSDSVTVTWSTTGSWAKNVIVADSPGIASIQALDPATAAAGPVTSSTAVSVTSGTPAVTGDLAYLVINNGNAGSTPSALGSFTSLASGHNGSTQYLTTAYLTASTTAVTGSATLAGSTTWCALLIMLSPTTVTGGVTGVLVGATIESGSYPGGTLSGSISEWVNQVINPGRTLDSIRIFFGPGNIPSSMSAGGLSAHAGVRRVLMSFKPALPSSDPTGAASDKAALNTLLASCAAGGLDAKVALYHEPDSAAGLSASQYKTCIQYYSATVRTYYPLVYCKAAYRTHVDPASPGNYYPGDAYVDECAYDFYCDDWYRYGQVLDSMAVIADGGGKPFSCWELGVIVGGVGGTTAGAPGKDPQSTGTAYMNYVTTYFKNRLGAGKPVGDLSYYNYVNASANWDFVIQPGAYLAPLYDAMYDAMTGSSPPPAAVSLASQIDINVNIAESVTSPQVILPGGIATGTASYPQLVVEAGFIPSAPAAILGSFILDDPVYGRLDSNRLAASTIWTDISAFVKSGTITRPSSRVAGPLITYQPGTVSLVLKNGDGRFDPDNTSSPYNGTIRAMIPIRVTAIWNGTAYPLFYGFADSWTDDGVNYGGQYAQVTLNATDGFKVLQGINLAGLATEAGGGENTGARIRRILTAAGWYTDKRLIATGNTSLQGTLYGDTALNLMQLAADTEIGELYIDGAGRVVFRNRQAVITDTRSNTPQALFGDSPGTIH